MKRLSYKRSDIIEVLRTLEELVVSLDRIGSYSYDHTNEECDAAIAAFIVKHRILQKSARARRILSEPFPTKLGRDEMDELERAMQRVRYWKAPVKSKKPNQTPEPTAPSGRGSS